MGTPVTCLALDNTWLELYCPPPDYSSCLTIEAGRHPPWKDLALLEGPSYYSVRALSGYSLIVGCSGCTGFSILSMFVCPSNIGCSVTVAFLSYSRMWALDSPPPLLLWHRPVPLCSGVRVSCHARCGVGLGLLHPCDSSRHCLEGGLLAVG